MINYGVENVGKITMDITSTHLSEFPYFLIQNSNYTFKFNIESQYSKSIFKLNTQYIKFQYSDSIFKIQYSTLNTQI